MNKTEQFEKKDKLKIILIIGLCIVTAVLIYFYLTTGKINNTSESVIEKASTNTPERLNSETDSVLFTFGIKKEWIKEISPKDKDLKKISDTGTQLLVKKEVYIPNDLPVIELNLDMTNFLNSRDLDVKVTEDPRSRDLSISIFNVYDSSRKTTGLLKFSYKDSLKRNTSDVCIILDSLDAITLDEAAEILNSSREFSVFLPLRNDKAEYQSLVTETKTDHLIKFYAGNEDDITADFHDDMKESQWKSKVKSASISFANANGIILYNEGSDQEFYNNIKDEFRKNNITVFEDTIFTRFSGGENKVSSMIEHILSENSKGKKVQFYSVYFTIDEFRDYEKKIPGLRKSGYKFSNFSESIKKINNQNQ